MARTRQTLRASTGGKAPRRAIATKAARLSDRVSFASGRVVSASPEPSAAFVSSRRNEQALSDDNRQTVTSSVLRHFSWTKTTYHPQRVLPDLTSSEVFPEPDRETSWACFHHPLARPTRHLRDCRIN
ncbi:unnamed protein product [Chondrus crispus]|uniref:Uncharacterized protein n=1 Tax=Chondrus crispus TaxID=2769 RepID=S0F370_CHOCR|nr:unnamed protein product [Chondrus crispus]CDF77462.1 unnamed protein product [Chondrus crispus]|eukprot:XP_005712336.1 unnamed protein product [Chondrus crispus]